MKDKNCLYCGRSVNYSVGDYESWYRDIKEAQVISAPIGLPEIGKRIWCLIMDGEMKPMDLCNYCYTFLKTVMHYEGLTFEKHKITDSMKGDIRR